MYGLIVYTLALAALFLSWRADRGKTVRALAAGLRSLLRIIPSMFGIIGLIGLLLAVLPPELIQARLGREAGLAGTVGAALFGTITLIPGLVAFPLAGSLYREGAATMTVAAFITTLTMVGVVTAPAEIRLLGKKVTFWRNGLSFLFALVIAVLLEVILA